MLRKCLIITALVLGIFLSNTAYAVDTLLVDDFSRSSFVNFIGGHSGGDEELPGRCTPGFIWKPDEVFGRGGRSLKLNFDVSDNGSYSFYWMKLGAPQPDKDNVTYPLDLTGYNYLSFWVRGETGSERIKVELHQDTAGDGRFDFDKDIFSFIYVRPYLRRGITAEWQKVIVPLKDFGAIKDPSNVLELVFTFENRLGNTKGNVYIDDILFGKVSEEVLKAKIPATHEIPFTSPIYADGKPLTMGYKFGSLNKLSVNAVSGETLPRLEGVRFEYSDDQGKTWKAIGTDYNTSDEKYETTWLTTGLASPGDYQIRTAALYIKGSKTFSNAVKDCAVRSMSTEQFLDLITRKSFNFFWYNQDLDTGLFLDTAGTSDASTGVSGFGLTALAIGVERGWVNRAEAEDRALKCIYTFIGDPDNPSRPKAKDKNGFYYHFLERDTAKRAGKCEVSTVDTALLICGALAAGEYFGGRVKEAADQLYKKAEWPKFIYEIPGLEDKLFTMGWAPEKGFLSSYWDYYTDEAIIVSLLAVGSPTHPLDMKVFYDWQRRKGSYKKTEPYIYTWHGALFAHQYAHAWFDFRDKVDAEGVDWWENSKRATLANRQFAIDNSITYSTYGPYSWGVTSMDHPEGYTMHYGMTPNGRSQTIHDGTISPSGPAGSIVFTPILAIKTLKHFYYNYPFLWGEYGFHDSFNLDIEWTSSTYYGLGAGITLLAVENFQNGFVWRNFMKSGFIKDALAKAGFEDKAKEKDGATLEVDENLAGIKKAKARFDKLKNLEQIDSLEHGRLYLYKVDSIYEEIANELAASVDGTQDKELALEGQALLLTVYAQRFQPHRAENAFNKLVKLIDGLEGDESFKVGQLNKTTTFLTKEGLEAYALNLRIKSIPQLSQASITEVIKELKIQADGLFEKGRAYDAEPIYNQYIDLLSQYSPKEETEAKLTELAEAAFEKGQYDFAIKYYNHGMQRFSESPFNAYWQFKIARSYEESRDYERAMTNYEYFLKNYFNSEYLSEAVKRLGILYYTKVLSNDEAVSKLKELVSEFGDEDASDFNQVYIALIYLKSDDYKEAFKEFKNLLYKYPTTTLKHSVEKIVEGLEKKAGGEPAALSKTEGTELWKMYQPGKPILVSLSPLETNTRPGGIVVFEAKGIGDEDKYSMYEQDLTDLSRIPSMTKTGYEDDIAPVEWDAGDGGFVTEEQGATKQWRAPRKPGRYEIKIKVSDLGLVRLPDKGSRNDKADNVITAVVIVKPIWPIAAAGVILALWLGIIIYTLIKRKKK